MKIKDGYLLRKIADSHIVIAVGDEAMDFNGIITLNEVGAFLWNLLTEDIPKERLLEELLKEYSIDEQTAKQDISEFLNKLLGMGLLELEP